MLACKMLPLVSWSTVTPWHGVGILLDSSEEGGAVGFTKTCPSEIWEESNRAFCGGWSFSLHQGVRLDEVLDESTDDEDAPLTNAPAMRHFGVFHVLDVYCWHRHEVDIEALLCHLGNVVGISSRSSRSMQASAPTSQC